MSFARSVMEKMWQVKDHLVVCELETEESFLWKYKNDGKNNLAELRRNDVNVWFGTDATSFETSSLHHFGGKKFSEIRFNFPYPACYTTGANVVAEARKLLSGFLKSAKNIAQDANAEVGGGSISGQKISAAEGS